MKNIRVFYLKIFSFLEVKFSIYLNRRFFRNILQTFPAFKGTDYVWLFFSTIFYQGGNYCDFLFVFLHTKPLLKRGLL